MSEQQYRLLNAGETIPEGAEYWDEVALKWALSYKVGRDAPDTPYRVPLESGWVTLLPCPFCGGEPHRHRVRDGWRLSCHCGASIVAHDGGEPVETKWNLRANNQLSDQP